MRVKPGKEKKIGRLSLKEGEIAQGKVLDTNEEPVPGAEVVIASKNAVMPAHFGLLTRAGADATFSMSGLSAGQVFVGARRGPGERWVIEGPVSVASDVVVKLPAQHALTIKVRSKAGAPIEDVEFKMTDSPGDSGPGLTLALIGMADWMDVTDKVEMTKDGKHRITPLLAGDYCVAVQADPLARHGAIVRAGTTGTTGTSGTTGDWCALPRGHHSHSGVRALRPSPYPSVPFGPLDPLPSSDVTDVPRGESCERLCLALAAVAECHPVAGRGLAGVVAGPGVPEHIAALEVLAVGRLLEHQVLGEVVAVIARVEPGEEHLGAPVLDPVHAERLELIDRQRLRRAGVTPAHVPCVLGEHRAHVVTPNLFAEHRLVELAEAVLDADGQFHAGRELHGPVVGRLDAAAARERVDEQLLRPVGVHRAEPDRQHELRRRELDLQRSQHREAERRLFLEVDLGNEELHVLPDVGPEHGRRAVRNAVLVPPQPDLEPVALVGGQNQDVVLPDGVLRLDGHAEAPGLALRALPFAAATWSISTGTRRSGWRITDASRSTS